jgi:hypothetical protein
MRWHLNWCGQIDMIIKVNDLEYDFSLRKIPPYYKHGDKPEWDRTGATSHLMPQYTFDDTAAIDWIHENNIKYKIVYLIEDVGTNFRRIKFEDEDQAMAFKLMGFAIGDT